MLRRIFLAARSAAEKVRILGTGIPPATQATTLLATRRLGRFSLTKRPKRRGGRKDGCTGDPAPQTSRNVDSSRSLLF